MGLLAAITDPSVARQILECLALPTRAPPLAPAREVALESVIGRSAIKPLSEADGDLGFGFDQSPTEGGLSNEGS